MPPVKALVPVLLLLVATVPACTGSRRYRPISAWESRALAKVDRSIYPKDVVNDFGRHKRSQVAFTGLIRAVRLEELPQKLRVHFTVEHHYFDWIEDFGMQRQRILLSPRGEGTFTTTWDMKRNASRSIIRDSVGDMAIVYGMPAAVTNGVVDLRAYYVRVIKRRFVTTRMLDYGRTGKR